jgi:hypothetical protein
MKRNSNAAAADAVVLVGAQHAAPLREGIYT